MSTNWRERFHRLRNWLGNQSVGEQPVILQTTPAPLALNLGIDFGTSFTKVAFRDVGREETGIVTFDATSADEAMLTSVVNVSRTGDLSMGTPVGRDSASIKIRYLKMRLADVALPEHAKTMSDRIPELLDIDFNTKEGICALSSFFLATVIVRAQQWVLQHEAARAKGRTIQWSANIGVPVEYYDSPAISVFREVLAVAWAWAMANEIPARIDTLILRYHETHKSTNLEPSDCHAVAEIAAAVQSFVTSREARPGIYVYFDIGGGTLDGVAFRFVNRQGERQINFYSGKVAPLGVAAVKSRFLEPHADVGDALLINTELTSIQRKLLQPVQTDIQRLVSNIVLTAKKKDGGDWKSDAIKNTPRLLKQIGQIKPENISPLPVFIGGGGAGSSWYQSVILSTHRDFHLWNAGIPPYMLAEVAIPSDVSMNGLKASGFGRFAVAYGLSVPYGEGPNIGLPSEFSEVKRRPARQSTHVVDYFNSKDVFD
jgi:hypothetical protein